MSGMRQQFVETVGELLEADPLTALVLADISYDAFKGVAARFPQRVINVGIREQLMVSVAGGLALSGMRPIVHSYATFTVSRAFEQLKLDLSHQDVDAVVVSIGASYDSPTAGTTHFAPEDVALFDTLPGWQVHVPAQVREVGALLRHAVSAGGRHYLRLTEFDVPRLSLMSASTRPTAVVVAVGPTIGAVHEAVRDLDLRVVPMTTVRPFDAVALQRALLDVELPASVVLVEPYLAGTSAHEVAAALVDVPHRLLSLGVQRHDLRRYGTTADHDAAHGLDAAALRESIAAFAFGQLRQRIASGA
jgi:transketolase